MKPFKIIRNYRAIEEDLDQSLDMYKKDKKIKD